MTIILVIAVILVIGIVIYKANDAPADPKSLDNKTLLGSIAGQAEWLDKMWDSSLEVQGQQSIIDLATKRRRHLAELCKEVLTRDLFVEAAEYAKELEESGMSKEKAAVRAVQAKLFMSNGIFHRAEWANPEM